MSRYRDRYGYWRDYRRTDERAALSTGGDFRRFVIRSRNSRLRTDRDLARRVLITGVNYAIYPCKKMVRAMEICFS